MKGILFSLKVFCNIEKEERIQKFLKEISFLEKVDHPAIIRVYDNGIFTNTKGSDYPFVISEYYPSTLNDEMKAGISIIDKIIYTTNLLSGLQYLTTQEQKIIHRDIKPQNIFIKGRNAILGDFGLMKVLEKCEPSCIEEDITDIIVSAGAGMAFYYRTPDLVDYLNKKEMVTQASDIFQLGLVVAQMFTGSNPCKKCEKITDPIELLPISNINSKKYGALIASNIKLMLETDYSKRISHEKILDKWNGALETISKEIIEINGKI